MSNVRRFGRWRPHGGNTLHVSLGISRRALADWRIRATLRAPRHLGGALPSIPRLHRNATASRARQPTALHYDRSMGEPGGLPILSFTLLPRIRRARRAPPAPHNKGNITRRVRRSNRLTIGRGRDTWVAARRGRGAGRTASRGRSTSSLGCTGLSM